MQLAAAVAKLGEFQMPMRLNETMREYFRGRAEISEPEQAFLYANIEDPVLGPMIQEKLRNEDFYANSYLRTGISPNIISGGFRYNLIPGDAEATLDVRALPDEIRTSFFPRLRGSLTIRPLKSSRHRAAFRQLLPRPWERICFERSRRFRATCSQRRSPCRP